MLLPLLLIRPQTLFDDHLVSTQDKDDDRCTPTSGESALKERERTGEEILTEVIRKRKMRSGIGARVVDLEDLEALRLELFIRHKVDPNVRTVHNEARAKTTKETL